MTYVKTMLAIDTAMNACSAAVYDKARGRSFIRSEPMVRGHAEMLMPLVENVMAQSGLAYKDLECIVTTVGPGAFTGLRIGLSTAKALGLARDIPVVGLTTIEILAAQFFSAYQKPCAILIETKREDYYVCFFGANGKAVSEAAVMSGAAVAQALQPGMAIAGDAVERFSQEYPGFEKHLIEAPDPDVMFHLASDAGFEGAAEPVYLRGADVSVSKKIQRTLEAM